MNDSNHPSNAPGPAPQPPAGGFFSWIRGLGIVRRDDRWFAGVASGIAAKAGIDPLIVRGAFVVLALLGGPGILLYVIGWLLLPDTTGRIHVEEIIRGRAETWVMVTGIVLASLLLLPVLFGIFGISAAPFSGLWGWGGWMMPEWISVTFTVLWWIAVIGGGIWLLVWALNQKSRGAGRTGAGESSGTGTGSPAAPADSTASAPSSASDPAAGPSGSTNAPADPTPPAAAPYAPTPPTASSRDAGSPRAAADPAPASEGDAAGTAPHTEPSSFSDRAEQFAQRATTYGEGTAERTAERVDDWSDRVGKLGDAYVEQHAARSLGAGHVVLTLALALLAGGAAAFWAAGGWAGLGEPDIAADPWQVLTLGLVAAVAVLALSVIVAGVRGRTTGWVGFLAFCGVIALLFTSVLPWGTRFQPFGVASVACCGSEADDPAIAMIAGSTQVNLSGLDDRSEATEFEVWLAAGNVRVALPEDHPTIVKVNLTAGNIREDRASGEPGSPFSQAGPFLSRTVSSNLEGASAEEISTVTVNVLAGNVRVTGADGAAAGTNGTDPAIETDESRLEELIAERESVREELDVVEWEMQNPSASERELAELERRHEKLEAELDELEKETAR